MFQSLVQYQCKIKYLSNTYTKRCFFFLSERSVPTITQWLLNVSKTILSDIVNTLCPTCLGGQLASKKQKSLPCERALPLKDIVRHLRFKFLHDSLPFTHHLACSQAKKTCERSSERVAVINLPDGISVFSFILHFFFSFFLHRLFHHLMFAS